MMCIQKVVMVSALGVIKTTKGRWSDVETTYNILMLRERWGMAADCEDHGLVNSGRTGVKGLNKQQSQ